MVIYKNENEFKTKKIKVHFEERIELNNLKDGLFIN